MDEWSKWNADDYKRKIQARALVEEQHEWRRWTVEIPHIQFPSDWAVQIIPPFGGAVARFCVHKNGKRVSIYLDCYDELGVVGQPYWEIYPYDGDTYRCLMNDTNELIEAIGHALQPVDDNNEGAVEQ